jgi:hypothetical protein
MDQTVRQIPGKIRSKIRRAILQNSPRNVNTWILLIGQLYVGKGLIVTQQNVEARLVLLDQIVFEGESFLVVINLDEVDILSLSNQAAGLYFGKTVFVEIASNAAAEILGFAYV